MFKLLIDGKSVLSEDSVAMFKKNLEKFLENDMEHDSYMLLFQIAQKQLSTLKRWGTYNPSNDMYEFENYSIEYEYEIEYEEDDDVYSVGKTKYANTLYELLDDSDYFDVMLAYFNDQEGCVYDNAKIEFLGKELTNSLDISLYYYIESLYIDVKHEPSDFGINEDVPSTFVIVESLKDEESFRNMTTLTMLSILNNEEDRSKLHELFMEDEMLPMDDIILHHGYEVIRKMNNQELSQ